MTTRPTGSVMLILAILILVLIGGVFVAYLWETMNRLMAGYFEPVRLLISLPVLVVFGFLLRYMSRVIDRWHGEPDA